MITPELKTLASLNAVNTMFYGGISCIAPFLSVHMRTLGLTTRHLIWVHVASGMVCILAPLFIGSLAERKTSKPRRYLYKCCFTISLLLAVFGYTALLAVPRIQRIPRQQLVDFDCSSPINAVVNLEKCGNWETCSDVAAAWSSNTRFKLSHCRYKNKQEESSSSPFDTSKYDSQRLLHMCFRSTINTSNLCLVYDPHVRENNILEFSSDLTLWQYTEYRNVSVKDFSFSEDLDLPPFLNLCNFRPANTGTLINVSNKTHDSVFCKRAPGEDIDGIKCLLSMQVDGPRPVCYDVIGDLSLTFWMYLGLRSAADAFLIASICLLEGISLRVIQAGPYHRGAYGRTRLGPASTFVLCPVIVGVLVDYFTNIAGVADFSPSYFIFAAFEITTCSLMFVLPLPVGGNTVRYDISTASATEGYLSESEEKRGISLEMFVISVIVAISGTVWSLEQIFDFLLYEDIGFNRTMLGLTSSLGYLFGMPFLWVSKNLIQNIGEANLVSSAFAFHAIHLAGLSFIKEWSHWWWAVPFEMMKAFTTPILWIALAASVDHERSGRRIAMHYVLVILHFGIGGIFGCLLGGFLGEYRTMVISYRTTSLISLVMAVIYLALHHLHLKPRRRKRIAERCALQRQSMNGSSLLLVERMPVNGMLLPRRNNN